MASNLCLQAGQGGTLLRPQGHSGLKVVIDEFLSSPITSCKNNLHDAEMNNFFLTSVFWSPIEFSWLFLSKKKRSNFICSILIYDLNANLDN